MSRYTGPKCRLCRRQGSKLFLKGPRCYSANCAFEKRPVPPGSHRGGRRRVSDYGLQLREKQKVRFTYGITEEQFENYFASATKVPGVTGETLLSFLERRLDNVIFRAGMADSRSEARQMVLHGHFMVDGKKVNIPSYLVEERSVIALSERGQKNQKIKEIMEEEAKSLPAWLEVNPDTREIRILRKPERGDIDYPVQEQLIVEFYSK